MGYVLFCIGTKDCQIFTIFDETYYLEKQSAQNNRYIVSNKEVN